ncbi:MAG TPA: DUF802 domain-containing protein [Lysobacter sp.]|nr:DUF802 domain-containing protein [Lysobacter sp.]
MPRNTPLHVVLVVVFLVGLAAVGWIGAGYVGTNLLGVAVTLMIAAGYLAGALELHRYRQASATLTQAVTTAGSAGSGLRDWLDRLHPSLRNAVRLRIEGERVALPGPALTPYLVGLLVLLGMLGTLMGMMATLRGTGLALESASDLEAIRGSLGAPVKGLAFAFGTSIAGVASSAMLGLLSALCRRERLQAVQQLDVEIATTLRPHSQAWQREEAFRLLQQQTSLMPTLIDRLQTMVATIEQQNLAASERQTAGQQDFHARAEASHARLAASLEQSLKTGVADSAQAVVAALQPVVATTMAGLARETAAMQSTVSQSVQQQLDGLAAGIEAATRTAAGHWTATATAQQQANDRLVDDLHSSLSQFADTFEQRSTGLLDAVSTRLDASTDHTANAWNLALSRQEALNEQLATRNEQALATAAASFDDRAGALVSVLQQAHAELQTVLESRDQQRLAQWSEAFGSMTAALSQHWEQSGERVAGRQQEICDTLARTAGDISAQTQAHASDTIAEISRLVEAASEAPRAAAEVIAELRQKLSDSMVRDNAMLEERSRLLATLETLLDAVNHASTEQRTAVDALVGTTADLLERVGARFTDHIQAETGKLGTAAAHVTAGAVEVASLGDAFGAAVQAFGQSSEALGERLQHIETALDKSLARSDEQLAYYVAQAREVVDLSLLSQQQIIGELQHLARAAETQAG